MGQIKCGTLMRSVVSTLRQQLTPWSSSLLSDPNFPLDTLFTNTTSLCSSLNVTDQVSHPRKAAVPFILYATQHIHCPSDGFAHLQLTFECRPTIFVNTSCRVSLPSRTKNPSRPRPPKLDFKETEFYSGGSRFESELVCGLS